MPVRNKYKYFHQNHKQYERAALILAQNPNASLNALNGFMLMRETFRKTALRLRQEAGIVYAPPLSQHVVVDETMYREFCQTLDVTPNPGRVCPEFAIRCSAVGCWRITTLRAGLCYSHQQHKNIGKSRQKTTIKLGVLANPPTTSTHAPVPPIGVPHFLANPPITSTHAPVPPIGVPRWGAPTPTDTNTAPLRLLLDQVRAMMREMHIDRVFLPTSGAAEVYYIEKKCIELKD